MATPPDKKKLKGFKEFDPSKYIDTEPVINEAITKDTVVVSFGRMNPITVGHEKLVNKVSSEAARRKADPMVFMSHSQDAKKNPLSYDDKVKFAKKAFGNTIQQSASKTIIDIAKSLSGKYKNFVMVVGSDRVDEFQKMLSKYNGKDFNFENIEIVSAGERDPDAEGVEGMSASKMRALAADNNVKDFSKGLPKKLQSSATNIIAAVRKGMNMTEETAHKDIDEALNRQQRRKRSIAMRKNRFKIRRGKVKSERRTAVRDVLLKRAKKAAINIFKKKFAKNRPYAELSAGEKEMVDKRIEKISKKRIDSIARRLMPVVKQRERDRRASKAAAASGARKNESINEASMTDTRILKRPHQLFDSNNKPKTDARFRMFKKKNINESTTDLLQELDVLIESTEKFEDYYKGVPVHKKDDRAAHFKRNAEKDDNDSSAYAPAPGDSDVKTKESKHTKNYRKMYGENSVEESSEISEDATVSLKKKADKTKMPLGVLRKVFNRGMAAWKTGHRPGTTPEQWAHARVNSFITKSSGTWGGADKDLASQVRKEAVELSELSNTTLASYKKKAGDSASAADKAGNFPLGNKRFSGIIKATKKQFDNDTKNVAEAVDKSSDVYKQYLELKKKSVKELRDMIKRIHKVVDVNGYDKQGAISTILRDRHGNKKVAAAMGLDEATFKVDIEGLPAMFIDAESAPQVKKTLRQMLKKPDDKIRSVDRVQPAEVKKHFRLKSLGKEEESMEEEAGAGEEGTNKLVKRYKKDTPGCK